MRPGPAAALISDERIATPETRFSDRVQDDTRSLRGYPVGSLDVLRRDAGLGPESVVEHRLRHGHFHRAHPAPRGQSFRRRTESRHARRSGEAAGGIRRLPKRCRHRPTHQRRRTGRWISLSPRGVHRFNTPETRAEFSRILKPGGKIVLIWNERKLDATPFLRDFEALLLRFGTDYGRVRHENIDLPAMDAFFRGPYAAHFFANEQRFDFDGLKSRLLSASYAPGPRHPEFEPMLDRLRDIFDTHEKDGRVTMEYRTAVYIGQ